MRNRSWKISAALVLSCTLLALITAEAVTWLRRRAEVDPVSDQQKLARSLGIIRQSTAEHPGVLKVLFYGQSITKSGWHTAVVEHWHQRYPNTTFVVENLALGGFDSLALERTAARDLASFNPDFIIFHVYGDHWAYERIIRTMRSQTAADILVQTDHGNLMPDPVCLEGLSLSVQAAPGCAGHLWVHQRNWEDRMSYHLVPGFGKKYGLAFEPQRAWWRDYLLSTGTDPKSLLADYVHPNAQGKVLIAGFFNRYFDGLVDGWKAETEAGVSGLPPTALGGPVSFTGTRLELIASRPILALPQATVDGAGANTLDGCYLASRTNGLPGVPDWPALRRVTLNHDHTPEQWTATVTGVSADEASFRFRLRGSVSGDQGEGDSAQSFTSTNGLLTIDPQDWMLARAFALKHVPVTEPFTVTWTVDPVCGVAERIDERPAAAEYRYTLAAGLANGSHSAVITLAPDDLAAVRELRVYTPRLKTD